ncbi:hypothetical protein CERSUDRAFT_96299 [Gelatoporia subvermispora B]|uniref:Protein kinase domain-containing protein n=1 Tax=Ceriporiopsis subvermispora (strain B) TaxID=914234 RepID=M2PIT0_CERS8|nr:hypothetical protein CERSUDRAFT_96299 [Gelatoporia subvermispora B]
MPLFLRLPVVDGIAELEYDPSSGGNLGQFAPDGEGELNISILNNFKRHTSPVLQCTLTNSVSQTFHVVCKFGTGQKRIDAIRNECKIYERKLQHLQGTIVPRCFGIFQGIIYGRLEVCLVTEYCGTVVKDLYKTDWEFRTDTINALVSVHQAGVRYGRRSLFRPNKVLVNSEGRPVLFNFDTAEEHTCEHDPSKVTFTAHARCPPGEDFYCSELFYASDTALDLWELDSVILWNRHISRDIFHDMDAVIAQAPASLPRVMAREEAKAVIKEFLDNLERRRRCEDIVRTVPGVIDLPPSRTVTYRSTRG